MSSRHESFSKLVSYEYFCSEFQSRLDLVNAYGNQQFELAHDDTTFIHTQWVNVLRNKSIYFTESIYTIWAQDILGELCHGLSRFDTVMRSSAKYSESVDPETRVRIDFITKYCCEYFAVDFCAYQYRKIMPFGLADYERSTFIAVMALCRDVKADPLTARNFVKRLNYPDRSNLT